MSRNTGAMALWPEASSRIATHVRNISSGNIIGIGISPGESVPAGKDFGFSGYENNLVLINPQGSHIAEYTLQAQDLASGRHRVVFSDNTTFVYTIIGKDLPDADGLISAINISFDAE